MRASKHWRISVLLAVLVTCAAMLFVVSRTPSRWHVALTSDNWRIYNEDTLEFEAGGLRVKTRTTRHFGPIAISTTREWTQQQAHPQIDGQF